MELKNIKEGGRQNYVLVVGLIILSVYTIALTVVFIVKDQRYTSEMSDIINTLTKLQSQLSQVKKQPTSHHLQFFYDSFQQNTDYLLGGKLDHI